jgi:hypothetical protein
VTNEYYGSQQDFLYAIADMMREEYLAIICWFHAADR